MVNFIERLWPVKRIGRMNKPIAIAMVPVEECSDDASLRGIAPSSPKRGSFSSNSGSSVYSFIMVDSGDVMEDLARSKDVNERFRSAQRKSSISHESDDAKRATKAVEAPTDHEDNCGVKTVKDIGIPRKDLNN
jgi:hypothetical protein